MQILCKTESQLALFIFPTPEFRVGALFCEKSVSTVTHEVGARQDFRKWESGWGCVSKMNRS